MYQDITILPTFHATKIISTFIPLRVIESIERLIHFLSLLPSFEAI